MAGTTSTPSERGITRDGTRCVVPAIPPCDFCGDGTPGPYDFHTRMGPWAHGCHQHWILYRTGELGVGSGQLWVTEGAADHGDSQ